MSQVDVERFLGRLITDASFRARAASSLGTACHQDGFTLSTTEKSLLSQIDFSQFGRMAEALDASIRRK